MNTEPLLIHLRDLRKKSGLSLRVLSAAIGCPLSQLSAWENGTWPAANNLHRWGAVLGVQLSWLPLTYGQAAMAEEEEPKDE